MHMPACRYKCWWPSLFGFPQNQRQGKALRASTVHGQNKEVYWGWYGVGGTGRQSRMENYFHKGDLSPWEVLENDATHTSILSQPKTSTLISHCLWVHRDNCWQCAGQSGFLQSKGRPMTECRSWPQVVKLVCTAMVKQSRECGWIDFAMDIAHVPYSFDLKITLDQFFKEFSLWGKGHLKVRGPILRWLHLLTSLRRVNLYAQEYFQLIKLF